MSTVTKPRRETWRDWWPEGAQEPPDDDLLTRQELIAQLRAQGMPIDERTLRHWQATGAFPYGVLRWRGGGKGKGGATVVLYRPEVTVLAHRVRELQAEGYDLAEIGARLRIWTRHMYWPDNRTDDERIADTEDLLAHTDDVARAVKAAAPIIERFTAGGRIASVQVRFLADDGTVLFGSRTTIDPKDATKVFGASPRETN